MRICSPCCGIAPDSASGGEIHERELLLGLRAAGDEPHILLARHLPHPLSLAPCIEHVPIGRGLRWYAAPFVLPRRIARCVAEHGADLLRAHSVRVLGPACLLAKRRYGLRIPVVMHLHHWEPTPCTVALERWALRQADLVVADSAFAADQARSLGVERAQVVHCGVPPHAMPPSPLVQFERRHVLSIGPLVHRKNPFVAARIVQVAARGLAGWHLRWVGGGPLHRRYRRLRGAVFHGRLAERDKRRELSEAAIYLTPSRLEGFPLAVLEAMAWGVPVVAFRAASFPELVIDGVTGLLGETEAELADHVRRLILDAPLRRKLGEAARARALTEFPWSNTVSATRSAYAEAAETYRHESP